MFFVLRLLPKTRFSKCGRFASGRAQFRFRVLNAEITRLSVRWQFHFLLPYDAPATPFRTVRPLVTVRRLWYTCGQRRAGRYKRRRSARQSDVDHAARAAGSSLIRRNRLARRARSGRASTPSRRRLKHSDCAARPSVHGLRAPRIVRKLPKGSYWSERTGGAHVAASRSPPHTPSDNVIAAPPRSEQRDRSNLSWSLPSPQSMPQELQLSSRHRACVTRAV